MHENIFSELYSMLVNDTNNFWPKTFKHISFIDIFKAFDAGYVISLKIGWFRKVTVIGTNHSLHEKFVNKTLENSQEHQ